MKTKILVFVLVWTILVTGCSPSLNVRRNATVVFYNVENLFDTINDPHINDDEFLPESDKKWTQERYLKKLDDISRVIVNINPDDLPEVVGLCEIENRAVLDDLVKTGDLAGGKYRIVHVDSPDERGIDVALIYRGKEFKKLSHEALTVDPGFKTRDILYVYGKIGKDKMHFFVNHWPSRIGGADKTEPNRKAAAGVLKNKVDEILKKDAKAKIIIMGDMNDEPYNKSLLLTLEAKAPGSESFLINTMFPLYEQGLGSYKYNGTWNMLDNLVVSGALLSGKGYVTSSTGNIFHEEWMEYKGKDGKISPNRTYGGPNYYGGVSDHFPVYLKLKR